MHFSCPVKAIICFVPRNILSFCESEFCFELFSCVSLFPRVYVPQRHGAIRPVLWCWAANESDVETPHIHTSYVIFLLGGSVRDIKGFLVRWRIMSFLTMSRHMYKDFIAKVSKFWGVFVSLPVFKCQLRAVVSFIFIIAYNVSALLFTDVFVTAFGHRWRRRLSSIRLWFHTQYVSVGEIQCWWFRSLRWICYQ